MISLVPSLSVMIPSWTLGMRRGKSNSETRHTFYANQLVTGMQLARVLSFSGCYLGITLHIQEYTHLEEPRRTKHPVPKISLCHWRYCQSTSSPSATSNLTEIESKLYSSAGASCLSLQNTDRNRRGLGVRENERERPPICDGRATRASREYGASTRDATILLSPVRLWGHHRSSTWIRSACG